MVKEKVMFRNHSNVTNGNVKIPGRVDPLAAAQSHTGNLTHVIKWPTWLLTKIPFGKPLQTRPPFLKLKTASAPGAVTLNPAWSEATYWWLTDNCALTSDLRILEIPSYFTVLLTAIFANNVLSSSPTLMKK